MKKPQEKKLGGSRTTFTMRLPPGLYETIQEAAEHQAIGLSAFVRMAAKSHAAKVLKEKRRAA